MQSIIGFFILVIVSEFCRIVTIRKIIKANLVLYAFN